MVAAHSAFTVRRSRRCRFWGAISFPACPAQDALGSPTRQSLRAARQSRGWLIVARRCALSHAHVVQEPTMSGTGHHAHVAQRGSGDEQAICPRPAHPPPRDTGWSGRAEWRLVAVTEPRRHSSLSSCVLPSPSRRSRAPPVPPDGRATGTGRSTPHPRLARPRRRQSSRESATA